MAFSGRSLYAFTLPAELVDVLQVRLNALVQQEEPARPARKEEAPSSSLGCAACGIAALASLTEQRLHFRSDWHRYNVKLRLQSSSKPPVSEEAFHGLVDSLDDSLSGSASSDSSLSSSSSVNTVARLIKRTHLHTDDGPEKEANRSPLIWMTADAAAPDTQFGLYRVIFPESDAKGRAEPKDGWTTSLRRLQVRPEVPKVSKKAAAAMAARSEADLPAVPPELVTSAESRTWTFLFTGGGHFAAMVVSLVPKLSRGQGGKLESGLQILAHKTYHRYTTRRKQGGAQSANDAAKGMAKSVGSQLRRANEAALSDDVRALLASWKTLITGSELIFVRASRSNSRMFFDYEDAVMKRGDSRVRSVPFSTRRPTLAELERCFRELTTVKVSHLTADALAALDEAELKKTLLPAPQPSLPSVAAPTAPAAPKLSKEELSQRARWERVVEMAKKGRLDALISFVDRHPETSYTGALPDFAADHRTPTLLHVAVQADQSEVVRWLLYDTDADPTGNDARRPAYDLASSKATRNVFRRCMADQPIKWDWSGAAHVPSPLTAEQEAKERARDEVKRKAREREEARAAEEESSRSAAERAEREAKDAERVKQAAARQAAKGGPQRLGGGPPQKLVNAQTNGLSDEQRMRMEREQRARAAEARLSGR